jgi:hypothetical protein
MTQNIILFVALVGVIYRVCSRQIIAREWWIIGFVSLNICLVPWQMFVG